MSGERTIEGMEQARTEMTVSRRRVLAASGVAGVTGLAGCASIGSDGGDGGGNGGGDGGSDGGGDGGGDGGSGDGSAQTSDVTISFIPHSSGSSDPFWAIEEEGWNAAVDQLGVDGRYQGPDEFDPQQQVQNINSAISSGVDGLAVSISDPGLFDDPLQRAADEGIPVIAVNIPEFGERTLPYQGYVGNDETVVGNRVANQGIQAFEEMTGSTPERAVIPNHQPGNNVLKLRADGIKEVMNEQNIPVDEITTSAEPAENISALSSYQSSNDGLDLVCSLGPASGQPATQWIEENNLQGDVFISGVDITDQVMTAIQDDIYLGTVIQQPYLQGYLAGHYLTQKIVNGILAPKVTPTGPTWVNKNRLDLVETQIENTGGA